MNLNPNVSRKLVGGVIIFGAILLGFLFINQRDEGFNDKPITLEERMEKNAASGKLAFQQAITNTVGWRRTLDSSYIIFEDMPVSNWWGEARIEIINSRGGVEAVDLKFRFRQHGSSVACVAIRDEEFYKFLDNKKQ